MLPESFSLYIPYAGMVPWISVETLGIMAIVGNRYFFTTKGLEDDMCNPVGRDDWGAEHHSKSVYILRETSHVITCMLFSHLQRHMYVILSPVLLPVCCPVCLY